MNNNINNEPIFNNKSEELSINININNNNININNNSIHLNYY
jgi:hypothetical protein